ncbi:peptidase [Solirubrobacter sp. CPCC 204708]|uniref:M14 family zinc carboxypeptidase n=1 Tax=Solirubrobacter deserti TaxID=2282478 RepID=A0ABT4RR25_9ACTN|nr:M14 family zinc carboxypeptidase [Solirubrobacter deserti]MBE2319350.1 peptidase [Solirubrobacter deserti]MDA0140848.1 M14 family zinc carboxypeptidase [Solirubrobacter deserti]
MPVRLAKAAAAVAAAASLLLAPAAASAAWPQQNVLPVYPDNPNDASIPIGVIPYDEIAPKLNALQAASNRVSARVAGKSSGGRDLYVVTVTWPETDAESAQQEAWKDKIEDDPVAARTDEALLAGYKTPLFVNGNIHGNEWEGTDAILRVIEKWATATDAATETLLKRNRITLNVTSNPDGRVLGTRPNEAGYDLNRDLTIISQPESRLIRDLTVQTQSLFLLDLHGYVSPTLLWPSTPPHNPNNDYDLYIKHGLPAALDMEQGLKDLGYPETQRARIPFRDDEAGVWDDYPPIYVPSFALYQGTIPYTIEAPLNPRGGSLSLEERKRRSGINTDVHEVAINKALAYMQTNRNQLIFDQAELFRRGWAGEPTKDIPDNFVPGWGPEDNYKTTFPRSYVIPVGAGQRSNAAAKRLVDLIIESNGRVTQAKAAFTAGGKSYAAGSYVIDMHQPLRGIVNTLLEPGLDITDRVDDLYAGPAGWSHALTWGATVDTLTSELPTVQTERIFSAPAVSSVPTAQTNLVLDPRDAQDLLAINALLAKGIKLTRLSDGSVLIPASARADALEEAQTRGLTLTSAPASFAGATLEDKIVVAYNGGAEVRDVLKALGFEAKAFTAATLGTTLTDDVDVLVVRDTLDPAALTGANKAAYDAFIARDGGVVGLGDRAATYTTNAGLLTATGQAGASLTSGVANVVNHGGPVVNSAQSTAWIFQPSWYSNLGPNAVVEQSFAADPLLAGWWPVDGNQGQTNAAGKASVVRGVSAGGNGVVLIGTSVVTRLHAKGLNATFGRAILFAADPVSKTSVPGTVGGTVPATLSLALGAPAAFQPFIPGVLQDYTAETTAKVISTAGNATLSVSEPGHLTNGAFQLAEPLRVEFSKSTWDGPVSNDEVDVAFKQLIKANDPLRTGTYSKTLTFTLSTTQP